MEQRTVLAGLGRSLSFSVLEEHAKSEVSLIRCELPREIKHFSFNGYSRDRKSLPLGKFREHTSEFRKEIR